MIAARNLLAMVVLAAVSSACFAPARYSGDGHLVDNGRLNYANRYNVHLGEIDLAQGGVSEFRLSGLPRATFVAGIEIEESGDLTVSGLEPKRRVSVRFEMHSADGKEVIIEEGPLSAWVRSFALHEPHRARLYRRGIARDVPLRNGDTKSEKLGVKASGGWGTYFKADPHAEYVLRVTVIESELSSKYPASISLLGW